jgi:adenylate cyclase
MTTQETKRKLTAILSADVKGYSRLMGEDEAGTIRTLNAHKEVMADLVQQYHGRIVDAPGDNLLAEFGSVVDVVRCAVEIQKELKTRNAELSENRRMEFRIGINLGDVVEEEGKLFGDGVNIAARLESLSEAGGICISGTAFDQVKNKLNLGYKYLGEQPVKNILEPVRVYRVLMEPEAAGKVIGEKKVRSKQSQTLVISLVTAVIVVVAAYVMWRLYLRPTPAIEVAPKGKMTFLFPDKPSIAVLPFVNMSGDSEQEYFSDGITEDIITNLSKLSGLFVVSRNSTFLYKGKHVKIEEVARDLGVRHVLEGSVRRAGGRMRITAQLIDGKTGQHVWAEKYDRELKDIFSVQDEVTRKVVSELAIALTTTETERLPRKHTESFEAYDLYLRAKWEQHVHRKENTLKSMGMCQRVIDLDPNFAGGYQLKSFLLSRGIRWGWFPKEDLEKALELAQEAISVDDKFPASHMALASIYVMQGKQDDALAAANRAANIQPGDSDTMVWLGYYLNWVGRGEEAVAAVKKSRELNPMYLSGRNSVYLDFMGQACFTAGLYEESISNLKKAKEIYGSSFGRDPFLIASCSMLGSMEEAKEAAQQWLKADPTFSLSSWQVGRLYKRPEDRERLYNALRKAGLPEKPSASVPPSAEVAPKEKTPAPKSEKVPKPVTPPSPKVEVASKEKMAFPLPDKPSIAVLPFTNIGGGKELEYFSDGLAEGIINGLAKSDRIFVIARNSTFTYKGKPVKVKQVAEEMGVQYVIEGSVQQERNRVRITAQLIDALKGRHLFSERYDRDLRDILNLQDEITLKVLTAVQVKLTKGEAARLSEKGTKNLDAYLKVLQAGEYKGGTLNKERVERAIQLLEEAIALDPEYAIAYSTLCTAHFDLVIIGASQSPRESLQRAVELGKKAIALDESNSTVHAYLTFPYMYLKEFDKAIEEAEKGVSLCPNSASAYFALGSALAAAGRFQEAIPMLQKSLRLSPIPVHSQVLGMLATSYGLLGQREEAIATYKKVLQIYGPDHLLAHIGLAANYALMDCENEARAEGAEVLRIDPKFSWERWVKGLPYSQSLKDRLADALRKAGLK